MPETTIESSAPVSAAVPSVESGHTGSGAFATARQQRRYWILVGTLAILSVLIAVGIVTWNNPVPFGTA